MNVKSLLCLVISIESSNKMKLKHHNFSHEFYIYVRKAVEATAFCIVLSNDMAKGEGRERSRKNLWHASRIAHQNWSPIIIRWCVNAENERLTVREIEIKRESESPFLA